MNRKKVDHQYATLFWSKGGPLWQNLCSEACFCLLR
uniref:Uncharacterized protein n=1 Tax=Arundo donax TaxID=35708 RepID=A0A0A9GNC4_ARUDO